MISCRMRLLLTPHMHHSSKSGSSVAWMKRLRRGRGMAKWTPRSLAGLPAAMTM